MVNNKWIWVVLSLILIFVLGFFMGKGCRKGPIAQDPIYFPPDTVFVRINSFIHDTVKGPYIPVKPNPQTDYNKPLPEHDWSDLTGNPTTIRSEDYIPDTTCWVYGELLKKYSSRFLGNYPTNPKLMRAKVGEKIISFDFLKPDGFPQSISYIMDLQNYSYTWEGGVMKAVAIPRSTPPVKLSLPRINFQADAFTTFNPFRKTARMGLEGTIYLGKLGITAYSSYTTGNSIPNFDVGTGLKIRLTK